MRHVKLKLVRPADLLLLLIFIAGVYLWLPDILRAGQVSDVAIVEIDGKVRYRLNLKHSEVISLDIFQPPVRIAINDGAVSVTENNCAHQICVRAGKIRHPGEAIICVPKKLLIYIPVKNENTSGAKAITG